LTASSRTLPFRAWGGGGAEAGATGEKVSSTTVLNCRAHGVEQAATERRATRLGRMVNDMITWEELERERYCVEESKSNVPEYSCAEG
jgi:hypothetical protein